MASNVVRYRDPRAETPAGGEVSPAKEDSFGPVDLGMWAGPEWDYVREAVAAEEDDK